jgi:crotonobetainyl-CoA:carnitine CoA-transferase CaiB-like acyl-CoA transferase
VTSEHSALSALWATFDLPASVLEQVRLTGPAHPLPSSFHVGTAAQSSIAAAAAAALLLYQTRTGDRQTVTVDSIRSAMECTAVFRIDGKTPDQWAPLSGLYQTADGYIRIHANFDHHRDAALACLDLPIGPETSREQVEARALQCNSETLDAAITDAGGACAVLRSFDEWDAHPQAQAIATLPLIEIDKMGDAAPRPLPTLNKNTAPLNGVRILDLTRILAGPICGRTLAAYGADVMLINSPTLPNIESIIDTSRGKRSALIDLNSANGPALLDALLQSTRVLVQGYRPGALAQHNLSAEALAARFPGIITTSLSAYGRTGPWQQRRGFDSLVQTATGFNDAEGKAFNSATPKALPVQILDYATGFLMAFATQVALYKQSTEGGSWHVQLSLAQTGAWLRSMGQTSSGLAVTTPTIDEYLHPYTSGYGKLEAPAHGAEFSDTPAQWNRPSNAPGSHPPSWDAS